MTKLNGALAIGTWNLYTPLNAVTATTTSFVMDIAGAKRISLAFTRADHSAGSSAFKVQVSVDGTTFVDFQGLVQDLENTNAQTKTRVTTITLSSDTTVMASMDLEHQIYKAMKVVGTETTDGTMSAVALVSQ